MKQILLLLCFISSYSYSDNVYLKSGYVYKNVIVIDTLENELRIQYGDLRQTIPLGDVRSVLKLPLIPLTKAILLKEDNQTSRSVQKETVTNYPNFKFFPVVVLAGFMAWNSLETASEAQNTIYANNQLAKTLKIPVDNSAIESAKSRNEIIGYVSILTAGITLGICFSDSQLEIVDNKLSMRLTF